MFAKVFLAIAFLVAVALCSDAEVAVEFGSFIAKFNKKYDTIEETIKRYNIFKEAYAYIEEHNSKNSDYKLGINQFADLTKEEFAAKYLTYKPSVENACTVKHIPTEPKPVIDWRSKGAVTQMKNQGSCGSCWAFSAVGALEGLHAIKTGNLTEYSEQELVDCSVGYGDNHGCAGGDMSQAFEYVKDHAISTRKEYPYEAKNGRCRKKSESFKISGCVNVTADDSNELLEALSYGPVSIAVKGGNYNFQYYRSGIITKDCGSDKDHLSHGILLVGAGISSGTPYWIVKNSWGSFWGMDGYGYIKRDTSKGHGVCGIAMENSYPVLE